MGQFMDRLHAALVQRGVRFSFGATIGPDAIDPMRRTVIATNASAAARLLAPHAPEFSRAASKVIVAPAYPVTAFFEPRDRDVRGFGILFPRGAGVAALGVRFNNDIFAGRGSLRSETWIYAGDEVDEGALAEYVRADRRVVTGENVAPIAIYPTIWREAIPVYNDAVLSTSAARAALPRSIGVVGNYVGKIGVAGLLDIAAETAARLTRS